jgi:hypothetical protein
MALFSLSKSQEIADLQAKVDGIAAERDTLATANANAVATIATLTAERDTALAAIQTEKDKAAAAELGRSEAAVRLAQIETEKAAAIEAEVITRLASAGVAPIAKGNTEDSNTKTINRTEFNKLSARAQSDFCKAGGIVIN